MDYISLSTENIESQHICCAFSDKKCTASYQAKKEWLKQEFDNDYTFIRLDERAKVFIEYGPAEQAWQPIDAPNYLALGCFWVSGKYKQSGHGKALLQQVIDVAKQQGKHGVVAVVGNKKYHFMSDTKWLLKQGFVQCDSNDDGFVLLSLKLTPSAPPPSFKASVKAPHIEASGCVVYYSNRCPYSEYHVIESLVESCAKRGIALTTVKFDTAEQAQNSPTPATIFSLFYNKQFITTDISACMDSRFDRFIKTVDQ